MFEFKRILLLCCITLISGVSLFADTPGKKNLGFENGNFDGWVGYQWQHSTASDVASSFNTLPAKVSLPTSRRHVIISSQYATDPNTGNALRMVPDGYKYSARLGCEIISSDQSPRCWQQSLQYTMKVDSSNAFLLLKFACVLQYSTSHDNITEMEPHFQLSLYDEKDNLIEDCSNYDVYTSGNMESEFRTYTPSGSNSPVKWRDWTTVGADLSKYIGQEVTIEFLSADCTGHYHYGYAYFVVDCLPLYITVDYCKGDSYATLEAPDGFETYKWLGNDSATVVGTERDLILEDPTEGETYYCIMESETGCEINLSSTIARYEPVADFSAKMSDCFTNEVLFTNTSTTNNGTLGYLWKFDENSTSYTTDKSFVYRFETSGMHDVSLIVYNPPSGCTDTIIKQVESFSPPLVGFTGDTTYCPGLATELTAFGAYSYEWSTGENSESVYFKAPGGEYWLLGRSTPEEGCISDTINFSISEEPDWQFYWSGDTVLCTGDTITLSADGAVDYTWSTGDSTSYIYVSSDGTFSVSGTNPRGCIKKLQIELKEIKKPVFDISLNPQTINTRNNLVDFKAESDENLTYYWELGDGETNSLQRFTHIYDASSLISYPVFVTTTNQAGCYSNKSAFVVVEPFIPNVFSPNNDGINDIFMKGYMLTIFDRHGIVLYSGEDGWNGYYNGKKSDPDTYFYRLNYTDLDNEQHVKKGFITLVR